MGLSNAECSMHFDVAAIISHCKCAACHLHVCTITAYEFQKENCHTDKTVSATKNGERAKVREGAREAEKERNRTKHTSNEMFFLLLLSVFSRWLNFLTTQLRYLEWVVLFIFFFGETCSR